MKFIIILLVFVSNTFFLNATEKTIAFKKQNKKDMYYFVKFGVFTGNSIVNQNDLISKLKAVPSVHKAFIQNGVYSSNKSLTCIMYTTSEPDATLIRNELQKMQLDFLLESVEVLSKKIKPIIN